MTYNLQKKHYLIIGIWFLVNLLQSIFTGLHSDESYYWMYSENLSWGYFDHPPLVAGLVHLGHWLIKGEVGVRLLFIIISTITFALIINELNEQKDFFFLTVFVLSFPLIHTHIAGFLALPDIPLLFFTVMFLLIYRKFLFDPGIKISILLAIVTAAMIYSKYHAFLIIGFTILSNLKLLRNKYFYLTALITVILLSPHIIWQIENELPTFRYHILERAKPFRLKYVFPNFGNQLIMAGPLTGVLIFWKLTKFKMRNYFDRALIFNILGFYILFFLMSFKNRIEAHWTASIIPMLMLAVYPLIRGDQKIKLWFKRLAVPVIVILMLLRIYLAVDRIPNIGQIKITFYNREAKALEIKKMAQGKIVGFFNNYAAISNYYFYTRDSAILLATPDYRFCQYDLWNIEGFAEGKPVFAIQSKHLDPPNLTRMVTGEYKGFVEIEEFQSLKGLMIIAEKIAVMNGKYLFEIKLQNTNRRCINITHVSQPSFGLMQDKKEIVSFPLSSFTGRKKLKSGENFTFKFSIPENKIDSGSPLIIYTRSKNNVRGEIISLKPNFFSKISAHK